ncbi:PepSY domain-containing protein [Altererythrobacter aerius]|uniref:PepSY domain-containing protein n=1 Tax=Tsuneonella aeria TaxID=1837929 RepID=A0A6I4TIY4_9SPHN|nr:PepSY domain-containing protein [Tsuneonella aeria]MXO76015.1 PepSY domain-containing protein [Tsuneonella aeria]
MTRRPTARILARTAIVTGLLAIASPALADGNVKCNGGPQEKWQKIDKLKKKAWLEKWTVQKLQVQGDCFEVYARTDSGQAIEAFFHPVTLQKLVVFRRGQEIWRAKGFTG